MQIEPFPIAPVDERVFSDLRTSTMASAALTMARDIDLFDTLADAPRGISNVAAIHDVPLRSAEALLATMAALGCLESTPNGRYAVTELTRTYLLADSPFETHRLLIDDEPLVERLTTAYKSKDGPPEPYAVIMGDLSDEGIRTFIGQMHMISLPAAGGLGKLEMFAQVGAVLDVGGGSGSLCCGVASQHPHIRCTIMDLAPVCRIAEENVAAYGLADRVTTHAADMFRDEWPTGHDAILFGNIFHDWDYASCETLARRSFETLDSGGRIRLHEMLLNEAKDGPLAVACMSLAMLMHEKGKQFTPSELEGLLADAGFVDFGVTPSFGYYSVASARTP